MSAVVSLRDLCLRRGTRDILNGVSFDVFPGEIVALMGLSGSGKTTILRVIAGLERGFGGAVTAGSAKAEPAAPKRDSAKAGMVFQFHFLFEHLTVLDNVCLAPVRVAHMDRRAAEARARELLEQLGIGHRLTALPRELSGGEAQRAAIARALAMDPPLLLMDEPTASLDPARRTSLGTTLGQLAATGRAMLVTSHDADFVHDHATRVVILAGGEVVESGDPKIVLTQPQHQATRELLQAEAKTAASRP
jgi:polar amino acid transport system ATP-binding protein